MKLFSLTAIKRRYLEITWGWIVDREWYLARYLDVAENGLDPVKHYFANGAYEGRLPNPLFDPIWITENAGYELSVGDAFQYYRDSGGTISPHPLYLDIWYQKECRLTSEVARYKDLIVRGRFDCVSSHPLIDRDTLPDSLKRAPLQVLIDLLTSGSDKLVQTHVLFSPARYLRRYPDVESFGSHPLIHFLRHGWREGRDPHLLFNTSWYIERYSEFLSPLDCPLVHYLTSNLESEFDPCPQFSDSWYCATYDLTGISGMLVHYIKNIGSWNLAPTSWWKDSLFAQVEDMDAISPLEQILDRVNYDPSLDLEISGWDEQGNALFEVSSINRSAQAIAICIPGPFYGSGGHRTIFNIVRELIESGYEVHIFCDWSRDSERNSLRGSIIQFFYDGLDTPELSRALVCHGHLDIPKGFSIYLATMWSTVPKILRSGISPKEMVYLVQDYEPYFYRERALVAEAEASYRHGIRSITIGRWLADFLTKKYGCQAEPIDLCADKELYRPGEPVSVASVLFLYQPLKPRRCAQLGIEALRIVKERLPQVEIHLYGSDISVSEIGDNFIQHGIVPPARCAELYRSSRLGLCFSATNPSRIPFEMMASGLPVIELDGESTQADLANSGAVRLPGDPNVIAKKIVEILLDDELYLNLRSAALSFMADRDLACERKMAAKLIVG